MTDNEARLATRIDRGVDERLRLTATVRGKRLGRFLSELLDTHLPSARELADLISRRGAGPDDDAR
jgi:hypothetical protein